MSAQLCQNCGATAEPGISECLECWVAQPAHIERAIAKINAGVPFRQAKIETLREYQATGRQVRS